MRTRSDPFKDEERNSNLVDDDGYDGTRQMPSDTEPKKSVSMELK